MIFTPNQIDELLEILSRYTNTFIAYNVGTEVLSKKDLALLRTAGIDIYKISNNRSNITQAFKFGLLSDAIGNKNAKSMSYEGFKKFLETGKFIELNETENNALQSLKNQTYTEVKGLESRIKSEFRQELVRVDKENNQIVYAPSVTLAAKKTIERRRGVSHMVSELGHMTGKWNKDLGRISDFVLHTSFDEGRALSFERREGKDALVFKDVYPGACKHCIKAYLTGGIGSEPKIFKLSELKSNGDNVGKKVDEWRPVVGPLHPWCRCTLDRVPFGFTLEGLRNGEWEWVGNNFVRTSKKIEPKVKRRKVKVVIGGETKYV